MINSSKISPTEGSLLDMATPCIRYEYTISFDDIPITLTKEQVEEAFGTHSYHLGAWPENNQPVVTDSGLPPVGETSHVVRDVELDEDGNLHISFEFISSMRGFSLAKQYDTGDFKMVPVLTPDGINISRFDFVSDLTSKEE